MQLLGREADNPDQRISEDLRKFVESTYSLSIGLMNQVATLVSFVAILWAVSARVHRAGNRAGKSPACWSGSASLYAALGTWITHLIGRPLIGLNFQQERVEADYRFSLARLREYTEQVALLGGEPAEEQGLARRFGRDRRQLHADRVPPDQAQHLHAELLPGERGGALHPHGALLFRRQDHARADAAGRRRLFAGRNRAHLLHHDLHDARRLQGRARPADELRGRDRVGPAGRRREQDRTAALEGAATLALKDLELEAARRALAAAGRFRRLPGRRGDPSDRAVRARANRPCSGRSPASGPSARDRWRCPKARA